MVVKDHMYDSKIVDIKFHSSINGRAGQHVISSDRHIIKVGGCAKRWATAGQVPASSAQQVQAVLASWWPDGCVSSAFCSPSPVGVAGGQQQGLHPH